MATTYSFTETTNSVYFTLTVNPSLQNLLLRNPEQATLQWYEIREDKPRSIFDRKVVQTK